MEEEDACSDAGVGGCDSLSLKPPPVAGVCADGVEGWPWPPVLRVSFRGAMFASRRQATRWKNAVLMRWCSDSGQAMGVGTEFEGCGVTVNLRVGVGSDTA